MNLVRLITPTNLDEAKEKFFKSKNYSPIFEYDFKGFSEYKNPIDSKERLIDAILRQNTKEITETAKQLFQVDLVKYKRQAESVVKNTKVGTVSFSIEDIQGQFGNAISFLGLDYKLSIIDKKGFNFRPSYKTKELLMSKFANLEFFSVWGEIQHELTHIVRYENHKFNKLKQSSDYLPTEEGLATLMQDSSKDEKNYSKFQHAAEYIASGVGVLGSLRDIFNYLIGIGFSTELAWQRAIRHKFGFIDTSKPGDIIKPAMYFENSQDIAKLPKAQILKLFQGRISVKDIERVGNLQGVVPEEKIIKFFEYFGM